MHICSRVTLAEQREAMAAKSLASPSGVSEHDAWVTSEAMEEWLVEVGFLEELFGSSMHVELVSPAWHYTLWLMSTHYTSIPS